MEESELIVRVVVAGRCDAHELIRVLRSLAAYRCREVELRAALTLMVTRDFSKHTGARSGQTADQWRVYVGQWPGFRQGVAQVRMRVTVWPR